ncbi:MAG: hypothetical protein HUK22_00775 [Thermoguttaceae bacterium]|nr:hypothetical protein [Thermoguttaceae bacterium]
MLNGLTFVRGVTPNEGGAIFNNGSITVTNSTFWYNSAIYGGAIANGASLTVINSTFGQNEAKYGGAISNNSGDTIIVNSTLTENHVNKGGGLYKSAAQGKVTFLNSLATGNFAYFNGGDAYNVGGEALDFYSSIVGGVGGSASFSTSSKEIEWLTVFEDHFGVVYEDGAAKILEDGPAAGSGTLVGKIGDDWYYVNTTTSGGRSLARPLRQ